MENIRKRHLIKRHRKQFVCLAAAFLLGLSAVPAEAAEAKEVIRVGCIDNKDFLEVEDGNYVYGYGAEYLRAVAKYTGWEYEYVPGVWGELLDMLERGEIDLLLPAEYSRERAEKFLFSEKQCCTDYAAILARSGDDSLYYGDGVSLDGKRAGMIKDNFLNEIFDAYAAENGFSVEKVFYEGGGEMEEALKSGEVDIIINGNFTARTDQKLLAFIGTFPAYFIMNREDGSRMDMLNEAMYRIECLTPYYEAELYEKYYGKANRQSVGFTREEMEYIQGAGEISVAYANDRKPMEYYDEKDGLYKGFYTDIVGMIAEISGLKFVAAPYREGSSFDRLKEGGADIIASATETRKLAQDYGIVYTDSYYDAVFSLVTRSNMTPDIGGDIRVAVPASLFGTIEIAGERYPTWKMTPYEGGEGCMEALGSGEVDAVLLSSLMLQTGNYLADDDNKFVVALPSALEVPVSIGVSGGRSPLLVSVLNKAISKLDESRIQECEVLTRVNYQPPASLKGILRAYPAQAALLLTVFVALTVFLLLQIRMNRISRKWNEELLAASNAKSAFLSKMSHEIRTPLNGINGSLNILAETEGLQGNRYIGIAKSSVKHLTGVINNILDMSKIESGKIELEEAFLPYAELERRVYDVVLPMAEEKGVTVMKPVILSPHGGIYADGMRLVQIVLNLMSNAVKYTPEGGSVTLNMDVEAAGEDKEKLRIEVLDEGIGMSQEMMDRMYEPFEQEENSGNILGSGLGLTITKELVELMGGTLQIDSRLGEGTRAVVEIVFRWGNGAEEGEEETGPPAFYDRRALLVEDNEINAEIARVQLQKFGLTVECAADGKQALERFLESPEGYYDVIFMDIMMPVMDGYETTKAIRSAPREDAADVLIVAMTALAFAEDAERSLKCGMNYHLSKPFEPEEIGKILKETWPG